jgi:hypothetical protein
VIKELIDSIVINRGKPGPFTMDGVVVNWRTA